MVSKQIDGVLTDTKEYGVSESFMRHFALQYGAVEKFVSKKIGGIYRRSASLPSTPNFGSSAFIDFIHSLQLDISERIFRLPLRYLSMQR